MTDETLRNIVIDAGQFAYPVLYTGLLVTGNADFVTHAMATVMLWAYVFFHVFSVRRHRAVSDALNGGERA